MCSNDQMLIHYPSWTEAKCTLPTKHTHPTTTAPPTHTQEPPHSHTTTTSTYTSNHHTHTHHQPLFTHTHVNTNTTHTQHTPHSFTIGTLQKCSPHKWVRGNMKNKNPQENPHLYSLLFSLFQSLYLCITLTQILTLTLEGKSLEPLIVTICSIFPNMFVWCLLILSLWARGSADVFFAQCVLKKQRYSCIL